MLKHSHRPLLLLSNYHVLIQVIQRAAHLSPLRPNFILALAVVLVAATGPLINLSLSTTIPDIFPASQTPFGQTLLKISIGLQVLLLLFLICISGIFYSRLCRAGLRTRELRTVFIMLYASMNLLVLRTDFRLVEIYATSAKTAHTSSVVRHEWLFYIFEASMLLANELVCGFWHPGQYLSERDECYEQCCQGVEENEEVPCLTGSDGGRGMAKIYGTV